MSEKPTIEARLQRKFILMSVDEAHKARFQALCPDNWQMVVIQDLDDLGEWNEVLLHRFLLLDLDEFDAFDPLDVIRILRTQYQINIPVFCFGGDQDIQDEMRMARADRFFSVEEMEARLPEFLAQYNWGA